MKSPTFRRCSDMTLKEKQRTVDLLLMARQTGLTVSELAGHLDVHKSTVSRASMTVGNTVDLLSQNSDLATSSLGCRRVRSKL